MHTYSGSKLLHDVNGIRTRFWEQYTYERLRLF